MKTGVSGATAFNSSIVGRRFSANWCSVKPPTTRTHCGAGVRAHGRVGSGYPRLGLGPDDEEAPVADRDRFGGGVLPVEGRHLRIDDDQIFIGHTFSSRAYGWMTGASLRRRRR